MADNTTLSTGSGGDVIASDDITSVKYQRVKLTLGADGVNDGDVASGNPLPVSDAAGSLTVDNAVISIVGGGTEAAAQRVTIANDSTGLLSVDDNGSSLTVDNATISVVGGGTEATAQRVTLANDSTGLLSVDDNAGSLTIDNAALSVTGGGVEATALRVTIASDSTGVLSVDDNGGALTVDGTVTAAQATASSLNAQIQGTTARDAAVGANPLLGGGRSHIAIGTAPSAVGTDGDLVDVWCDDVGRQVVVNGAPSRVAGDTAGTAQGPKTTTLTGVTTVALVATPGASKSIYVTSLSASNTSATLSRLDVMDGSTIRHSMALAASGGGFVQAFDPPWKITANTALNGILGVTVTDVRVNVHYFEAA